MTKTSETDSNYWQHPHVLPGFTGEITAEIMARTTYIVSSTDLEPPKDSSETQQDDQQPKDH